MRKWLLHTFLIFIIALVLTECGSKPSYLERRREFATKLLYDEPAPQGWEDATPPTNTEETFYRSGDLELKAWVYVPDGDRQTRKPAIVYFHGGFAFAPSELEITRPFMDAGYVIMCPMLRGENGNPGSFELFFGEVDDASAAIKWLAEQPYVDSNRIYAFGHSVGGAISVLLSLRDDLPIQHSGSASGLYGPDVFEQWSEIVPFDTTIQEEISLRMLFGNIKDMHISHYAFMGEEERYFQKQAAIALREINSLEIQNPLLRTQVVPGDHFSALEPAMREYLRIIQETD
jgi:predicted alpha/beta-fold hydrolase